VRLTLFCHRPPFLGDEEAAIGDMGGVDAVGIEIDGEPRANGLMVVISAPLDDIDLGEGMAEPVEAYTGRNSSGL
jgi:hypothetical protein